MTTAPTYPSDIAFTPAVKAIQVEKGSRHAYARVEEGHGWATEITEELAEYIARQRSFFLATASADGQPYVQHRGGPPGFLRVVGPRTLGFADFRGNKQYISIGNLSENPKVNLFLIDYEERSRVKIWGRAEVIEDDEALLASLTPAGYAGRPERVILVHVTAWDQNCPQHIPVRLEAEQVKAALEAKDREIAALRAELAGLRQSA
jgi:predicted pyridoxine 5'-phosphate oxidase superfamily flavin-nucleotide-binding protein